MSLFSQHYNIYCKEYDYNIKMWMCGNVPTKIKILYIISDWTFEKVNSPYEAMVG